ncbi:programmed cell death 1 ligand 1-like [Dicentrarchus labrax]|uniref:programmed cell death 1 ligand 1-like n=1 Tax=Dicentrarchus labrax TaxID=13489 RepID=UPI0021F672DB|nr:programmed cell death 1 ligand 1-like [Dicentrarchus labrax]
MVCWILLLINLTSCVCGTFVVNGTQTSYQAEENHNITLEWTFTTNTERPPIPLFIYCELITDHKRSGVYDRYDGVEVSESQDEQFKGRVQCDKDALREGRLRLHVTRLRTEDSGLYRCEVLTNYGGNFGECRLNVIAARVQPKDERQEPPNQGTTTCCCRLAQAVVLLYWSIYLFFL